MERVTSAKRGLESPQRIEPTHLENPPAPVLDLATDLFGSAAVLGSRLHAGTAESLAGLVRIMNAYYSNLIEGHNTLPRDIARALEGDFSPNRERRNLQLEAAAHVRVQAEIDRMAREATLPEPASMEFIAWLHREFYRDAPEEMLRVRTSDPKYRMRPGRFRSGAADDVFVGRHQPPSSAQVDEFLRYFESQYRFANLGSAGRILAIPAAHHRLNYIHPFADGNGRVSRLMSHAMAHAAGIGSHGLWAISRGLARGLTSRDEYAQQMDAADAPRETARDGRGNLSRSALARFSEWFLLVANDQVAFMGELFDLDNLSVRLRLLADRHERWRSEARYILEAALVRGELRRGDIASISGLSERTARRMLDGLEADGILASSTPKGPVSLRFGQDTAELLFPRLLAPTLAQ